MREVDDGAAQRELNAALERFRGDPRVSLGLGPSDDAAAARRAFMALCKVYHPAKFARYAPATVKLCNEVFLLIRRTYETVIKPAPMPAPSAGPAAARTPAAVTPSGIAALKAHHVTPAHERTTTRMARHPATPPSGVPIYRSPPPALQPTQPMTPMTPETAQLEKGMEQARGQRWAEARITFTDLATRFPSDPRYRAWLHYARGWEAFGAGKPGEARGEWQRALACDPTNGLARWALESNGLAK